MIHLTLMCAALVETLSSVHVMSARSSSDRFTSTSHSVTPSSEYPTITTSVESMLSRTQSFELNTERFGYNTVFTSQSDRTSSITLSSSTFTDNIYSDRTVSPSSTQSGVISTSGYNNETSDNQETSIYSRTHLQYEASSMRTTFTPSHSMSWSREEAFGVSSEASFPMSESLSLWSESSQLSSESPTMAIYYDTSELTPSFNYYTTMEQTSSPFVKDTLTSLGYTLSNEMFTSKTVDSHEIPNTRSLSYQYEINVSLSSTFSGESTYRSPDSKSTSPVTVTGTFGIKSTSTYVSDIETTPSMISATSFSRTSNSFEYSKTPTTNIEETMSSNTIKDSISAKPSNEYIDTVSTGFISMSEKLEPSSTVTSFISRSNGTDTSLIKHSTSMFEASTLTSGSRSISQEIDTITYSVTFTTATTDMNEFEPSLTNTVIMSENGYLNTNADSNVTPAETDTPRTPKASMSSTEVVDTSITMTVSGTMTGNMIYSKTVSYSRSMTGDILSSREVTNSISISGSLRPSRTETVHVSMSLTVRRDSPETIMTMMAGGHSSSETVSGSRSKLEWTASSGTTTGYTSSGMIETQRTDVGSGYRSTGLDASRTDTGSSSTYEGLISYLTSIESSSVSNRIHSSIQPSRTLFGSSTTSEVIHSSRTDTASSSMSEGIHSSNKATESSSSLTRIQPSRTVWGSSSMSEGIHSSRTSTESSSSSTRIQPSRTVWGSSSMSEGIHSSRTSTESSSSSTRIQPSRTVWGSSSMSGGIHSSRTEIPTARTSDSSRRATEPTSLSEGMEPESSRVLISRSTSETSVLLQSTSMVEQSNTQPSLQVTVVTLQTSSQTFEKVLSSSTIRSSSQTTGIGSTSMPQTSTSGMTSCTNGMSTVTITESGACAVMTNIPATVTVTSVVTATVTVSASIETTTTRSGHMVIYYSKAAGRTGVDPRFLLSVVVLVTLFTVIGILN